jgi:menaquinone-dependent protoporphyrinogen oxidase
MNTETEKQQGMNRRHFLLVSCGVTFALVVHRSIAGASGAPASREFPESTCRRDAKRTKGVLIAYASRCGSTGSIAEAIGNVLCGMGASVDVRLVGNVKDLSPYQAVIVGSAIRRGNWLPEAAAFVKSNQDRFSRLPIAYFVVCLTMKDDTPENRDKALAYLDPVRKDAPRIRPAAVGLFPGVLDFSRLSFVNRSIFKAKGVSEGDYRNLAAEKGWASNVGPAFIAGQPRE